MPRVTKNTTKQRRRLERESRKESVLAAAEETFIKEGYRRATNDKVAERAGVSVGTVYNFFGNKDALYVTLVKRIGGELIDHTNESIMPVEDPERAVEQLIMYRLRNFERHKLLLMLFSGDRNAGSASNDEKLLKEVKKLYYGYLEAVSKIFAGGMERGVFERANAFNLALSFEGTLNALVGYWMRPGEADNLANHARHIKETFMRMAGIKAKTPEISADAPGESHRQIYVTSFDMARLKELITVARSFGSEKNSAHLNSLEQELINCKVVEPDSVPPDVVTMNSRIRLKRVKSGRSKICCLVFPVEAEIAKENLSVLDPLGTALLGQRVGDIVEAGADEKRKVIELLYQPESAGDYHR